MSSDEELWNTARPELLEDGTFDQEDREEQEFRDEETLIDEMLTQFETAYDNDEIFSLGETELERKELLKEESRKMSSIKKKIRANEDLHSSEEELLEKKSHKISSIKSPAVEIEAVEILADVVRGDYTLEDVHLARDSPEDAENHYPDEYSPLQLFDNIVEKEIEKTQEALNTSGQGLYFAKTDLNLSTKLKPNQIADAINHADTAIDLIQEAQIEPNEAKEACKYFIKASAMVEAENNIKQLQKSQEMQEKLQNSAKATDESAQESSKSESNQKSKHINFEITDLNFDISFLPIDDPNVYKPLEIISYMGMTK
jgi:hypothetical protein